MSEAWFSSQMLPGGSPEDSCDPQEAAALNDYIHSTKVTADAAACSITSPMIDTPRTIRFGNLWADLGVSNDWRKVIGESAIEQREDLRQYYIQQATIEAQFVIADIHGTPISWGLGCICDALERSDVVPDFEVLATKEWLEIAGDRIFADLDGEVAEYLRERDLWKHHEGEGRKQRWGS